MVEPFPSRSLNSVRILTELFPKQQICTLKFNEWRDRWRRDRRGRKAIYISSPPFSIKFDVLDHFMSEDGAFALLLPTRVITSETFQLLARKHRYEPKVIILPRRVHYYDGNGIQRRRTAFNSCYITNKLKQRRNLEYTHLIGVHMELSEEERREILADLPKIGTEATIEELAEKYLEEEQPEAYWQCTEHGEEVSIISTEKEHNNCNGCRCNEPTCVLALMQQSADVWAATEQLQDGKVSLSTLIEDERIQIYANQTRKNIDNNEHAMNLEKERWSLSETLIITIKICAVMQRNGIIKVMAGCDNNQQFHLPKINIYEN